MEPEKGSTDKIGRRKAPAWIGFASLLCGLLAFTIFQWVLTGRLGSPLGAKGEGLLFALLVYVPVRILLGVAYRGRSAGPLEG